jgi:predicted dehydrogenase
MNQPVNIAIVGLGKMGISHLGIANATPNLKVTAVCDSSSLLGQMIERPLAEPPPAEAVAAALEGRRAPSSNLCARVPGR